VEKWVELGGIVENGEGYKVSNTGKVWSTKTNRYLKPARRINGYLFVCLSQNSIVKQYDIHRLVALAHLTRRDRHKIEVNHINGNKEDNKVDNLEWVSSSENKKHAYRNGLRNPVPPSNTRRAIKVNRKPVIKREVSTGIVIGVYESANYLVKCSNDTPRTTISYQCRLETLPTKSKYYYRFASNEQVENAKELGLYFSERQAITWRKNSVD